MTLAVLAAVTGAPWEAELLAALDERPAGVRVERRCLDLADLLATAATGMSRAALVSADLRRLDRDAVSRLAACGVAVVGLVDPGNERAEEWLRRLGVDHVLPADSGAAAVAAAVVAAVGQGDPPARPPRPRDPEDEIVPGGAASGRLCAVWGPTGAPGRTTVAVELAGELARTGVQTLLADADVYGGVVAQRLGLLDEAPGLAAAARLANNGQLDLPALARSAPLVEARLRVLTGISRASRWPELRPAALAQVWLLCRALAAWTVVDCGFSLEHDEELSYDTAAPRRNGATIDLLQGADIVLAVGSADPVGMQRLVRGLAELHEIAPQPPVRVILNRVRRGAVGGNVRRQLTEALQHHSGVADAHLVPADPPALDAAVLTARLLADVAPDSPARVALAALAAEVAGTAVRPRRGRLRPVGGRRR